MSSRYFSSIVFGLSLLMVFSACSGVQSITTLSSTPTAVQEPILPTPTTPREPTATFEPYVLPLSGYGPFFIGKRGYNFEDSARNYRPVNLSVWYPAIKPQDFAETLLIDAEPDPTGAPYALILSSAKVAGIFAPHLVSHGFVVVGIRNIDTYEPWDENLIDQPLDILFALDQVELKQLPGLEGIIDSERTGALGYSFDGYNALALSGARVDPEYYLEFCANPSLDEHWIKWGYCEPANTWEEFSDHAGSAITTSNDGLWQPMTDERIRAVMPMAPDGAILFGERGLSSVDRPTLIIGATEDTICTYNLEAVYIFEHISESNRTMISFTGKGHMMINDQEQVPHMKHFAAAFFGYYLQGNEDYALYFSKGFIDRYPALNWGGEIGH